MSSKSLRAVSRQETFSPLDPEQIELLNRLHRFIETVGKEDREQRRYCAAANHQETNLCTPVAYRDVDLSHIPERILKIDYGCGDPTRYVREGEIVLDLGSGSGKQCFMMARKVGAKGRVIGIDKTPAMLELARGAVQEVTKNLGYPHPNVESRRGHIEELGWDIELLNKILARQNVTRYADLQAIAEELAAKPLVASSSIDLVVSNCVLNLVNDTRKKQLFREIYRVLKHGGRAVISDIVADQDVPAELKKNDELWTGCISGALRRDRFLAAFAEAGFYGIQELSSSFWRSESGQHFHTVTVAAYKGKEGPCWETYRNVYYVGPFSAVEDDDGHRYERGQSVPVCEKTARILNREPYAGHFLVSEGLADESEQIHFDCSGNTRNGDISPAIRDAMNRSSGLASGPSECGPEGNCC